MDFFFVGGTLLLTNNMLVYVDKNIKNTAGTKKT